MARAKRFTDFFYNPRTAKRRLSLRYRRFDREDLSVLPLARSAHKGEMKRGWEGRRWPNVHGEAHSDGIVDETSGDLCKGSDGKSTGRGNVTSSSAFTLRPLLVSSPSPLPCPDSLTTSHYRNSARTSLQDWPSASPALQYLWSLQSSLSPTSRPGAALETG